ncbi:MAG: RIP metalloprotease RseP [Muribaculaceae bacterium]|nr:RIP metalloprotease RseP [Muribaculaceae bacterium]MDE6537009.1 RIP metalloprotease RseP [Muribaculaceae bacterium]
METFLIKAAQLILAFAILVIIHEFGHFLFARIFGIKVEKFYIFFDPWKSLFKWKPKSKKKNSFWGDTEYGIGWLPLGGYCKIAGMVDESMDTEQLKKEPQPWEFRSKPAWQRLLVMIAGVLFNFLLAIIIYAGIVYATGEKYVPMNEARMGMEFSGEARKIGFHNGDIPVKADGEALDRPADAFMKMMQAKKVTVLRDGKEVDINIPEKFIFNIEQEAKSDTASIAFFAYRFPARVTQLMPGEGAAKAGIKEGDTFIAIDSVATPSILDFQKKLAGHDDQTVNVTFTRMTENRLDTLTLPVKLSSSSKMGIGLEIDPSAFFNSKEINYSLLQSVPRGIEMGTDKLTAYAKSMKMVFTKEGANSIGGFGSLGAIFPEKWNWIAFWNIAAFLSVALAFMNILPIPALDGGHVLFLLYEVVTGRKPSDKFLEYAQMTGMVLLILLLLYANGMDIVRLFK